MRYSCFLRDIESRINDVASKTSYVASDVWCDRKDSEIATLTQVGIPSKCSVVNGSRYIQG